MSAFLQEVEDQPKVLLDLVEYYRKEGRVLLQRWVERVWGTRGVRFVGMGTSKFVGESIGKGLAQRGFGSLTVDAGELLHYTNSWDGVDVLVSQSGETVEIVKLLEQRGTGRKPLVAVTNDELSTLSRNSQLVMPICAGKESAITNKTYGNSLALLFLMERALWGRDQLKPALVLLESLAKHLAIKACDGESIERSVGLLVDATSIHFIARGPAMVSAKQSALTFMEGARISCTHFTGGAFRHGPFELVGPDHSAVFFIPEGRTAELLQSMAWEVVEKGSQVVVVTDHDLWEELPDNLAVIRVHPVGEALFPLSATTTQCLLLAALARRRKITAGIFRHGGKVTTRQ